MSKLFSALITFNADELEEADRMLQLLKAKIVHRTLSSRSLPFKTENDVLGAITNLSKNSHDSMNSQDQLAPSRLQRWKLASSELWAFVKYTWWLWLTLLAIVILVIVGTFSANAKNYRSHEANQVNLSSCERVGTALDNSGDSRHTYRQIFKCPDGQIFIR